jgi:hypothetical protein
MHQPLQVFRPDWNTAFCEHAEQARASRCWLLEHAAEQSTIVFTAHFPNSSAGKVTRRGDKIRLALCLSSKEFRNAKIRRDEDRHRRLMIASDTAGIKLFVRNKRRADVTGFSSERTLLFVAGSTYPASTSFDLPLAGVSWMDHLAGEGYDTWLVDIRGYGNSTRPPEMAAPAADNEPIVRTPVALCDIATALHRRPQRDRQQARTARPAMDPADAKPRRFGRGAGRLPHCRAVGRASTLAKRRAGRQEGGAAAGGLVRSVGGCDVFERAKRPRSRAVDGPERNGAGQPRILGIGQAAVRPGPRHRAGADRPRRSRSRLPDRTVTRRLRRAEVRTLSALGGNRRGTHRFSWRTTAGRYLTRSMGSLGRSHEHEWVISAGQPSDRFGGDRNL